MTSDNQENFGWYLCGNPFPAALPLTRIEKNKALDGNIYVYNGNGYRTYSLNSSYALPPFAAFFVKASSSTELKVSSSTPTKATNIISTNFPVNQSRIEPHPGNQSTGIKNTNTEAFLFFIKDGQLHLQNIPEAGYLKIFNMAGHCILQKKIQQGSQVVQIREKSEGLHILRVYTGGTDNGYKIIL